MTDIACTLSAPELTARRALMSRLAADAVVDRVATSAGVRIRLRDSPAIEQRARELIAAESRCCPFLGFELGRAGGTLVLDVSGPPEAAPLVAEFLA
jgi:hypothetical protein